MKVVITGGAGFIGGHLLNALVDLGHEVHVIDRAVEKWKYRDSNYVTFHGFDIVQNNDLLSSVFAGATYIFHLAALTSVPESIEKPEEYHLNNVVGTLHVLEQARKSGVEKVIFSSSSAVYGEPKVVPTNEADITEPMSPYALDKLMGEELCLMYARTYGLGTVSLRYFNVYGEGMNESGAYAPAIAVFLKKKREGQPITVTGDGLQTRDFVHVSDVAQANIAAAVSSYKSGNIFNIGSGEEITMNEIAKIIDEKNIEHIAERQEPRRSCADIDAAMSMLNWKPEKSIREEVKRLSDRITN